MNGLKSCYLCLLVYVGSGAMGLGVMNNEICVVIVVWKWGVYFGDEGF